MRNSGTHIKSLEQAMAARFGWQSGASWRDKLLEAIRRKDVKLGVNEQAYCRMAIESPAELESLAEIISNSETRFFREPEQFEALRSRVLPGLIKSRSAERRLDLWSAACATGEEPYSLGIIVNELIAGGEGWRVSLLATDLRGPALTCATRGRYPSSSIGSISPSLRDRYFINAGASGREDAYDVQHSIRRMVMFRRANLYDSNFWKTLNRQFDLIVCNNLLLYFHALAVRQTVERIASALSHGGTLVVMPNEAGYIHHPRLKLDPSLPGSFFKKV